MHLAVQRGSRGLPMLAELLRLRADPTDYFGVSLLGNSPDVGTMEFLVQNRADVKIQARTYFRRVKSTGFACNLGH